MLMALSHCVVVRTFLVGSTGGSADVVSGGGGGSTFVFAMMLCALTRAFFYTSRASLVLSAIALPAATCFGFFCFVVGVFEVTCCSTGCCSVSAIHLLKKLYLIEQLPSNAHQLFSIC